MYNIFKKNIYNNFIYLFLFNNIIIKKKYILKIIYIINILLFKQIYLI